MKSYITSSLLLVASPLASAWVFPSSIQSCRAAVSTRLLAMQGADVSSRRNFFGQIGAFAATGFIAPSAAFASTPSISATEFTDLLLQGAENDEIDR